MMFGAGIRIGMLSFATAEPMYHFAANPSTIMGLTEGSTAGNVRDAYVWSFTHWGLAAWAAYAIVGLALAYFCYRRGLPRIVFGDWLYTVAADGTRSSSTLGIPFAFLVIIGASTLSALSGVGKGIKWLSNINMGLSFFVLFFFPGVRPPSSGSRPSLSGSGTTCSPSRATSSRCGPQTVPNRATPWPAGRVAGPSSTGPGGSRLYRLSACSWPASPRDVPFVNLSWAR